MARAAGLILLAALLAGCGDTPAGEALRRVGAPAAQPATPVAGPALLLAAPRRATLVPMQQTGARRLWRGEDGIVLATDGARIVGTAGLGQMLVATRVEGADPLDDPRALLAGGGTARRVVDLSGADRDPASMRFGLALDCTLRGQADGAWIIIEERCAGAGISFTNRFWALAETGQVARSEQWVGDAVPAVLSQLQP